MNDRADLYFLKAEDLEIYSKIKNKSDRAFKSECEAVFLSRLLREISLK